jgi:non-specific serine/threonine protein kinase
LTLLTGGAADAPDRQRTLRAAIDWSFELLVPADRDALARLSVFAGPFDLDAAAAVGPPDGVADSLDVVGRLVDQSLVVALPGEGEPRFRLLTPIREFAAEVLAATGLETDVRRAHASYVLGVVRTWSPLLEGAQDLEAVAAIAAMVEESRAAVDWLVGPDGDPGAALGLTAALGRFWYLRGRAREGRASIERALDAVETTGTTVTDELLAEGLTWAGVLADEEQRPVDATRRLTQALELRRRLDDQRGVARALNSLGVVARSAGDLDRAEALFTESLAIRRATGDPADSAITVSNLGIVASDRGDFAAARARFAEALALDRQSGKHASLAYSQLNLGGAQVWLGEVAPGIALIREALPVLLELEDTEVVAEALELLGDAALAAGDRPAAARLLLVAEALRERGGFPLRPVDTRRVEVALAGALAGLDAPELMRLRAEAAAHDLASAVELGLVSPTTDGSPAVS